MTPLQIVEELPDLEEEDVRQALAYAAALAQDELHDRTWPCIIAHGCLDTTGFVLIYLGVYPGL